MSELTRAFAEQRPFEPAVVDDHGARPWGELDERVNRAIAALRAAGLGPGSRCGLMGANRIEYFELMLALVQSGVRYVPINWHLAPSEIAYILEDSGAVGLIVDAEFGDQAREALSLLDGHRVPCRISFAGPCPPGFDDYEELLAGAPADEPDRQVAAFPEFYTSGTTGHPKAVETTLMRPDLTPSEFRASLEVSSQLFGLPPDGIALVPAPAYHTASFGITLMTLVRGFTLLVTRRFDALTTLRLIDEWRVTVLYAVPTHFVRFLKLDEELRSEIDVSSLRLVFHTGAPCPVEVKRAIIGWLGPVVVEYYGATEGPNNGTLITSEEWLDHPGSVGRASSSCEILIVGPEGQVLGPRQIGDVYFRSRNGVDFRYRGAPEKTAASHRADGTFTFGEIGYLDDDGYLYLCDRRVDMIVSGGANIYPAEVESVLLGHPDVADAAVFGIPDEEFGEQVKAAVVLREPGLARRETEQRIIEHCRTALAGFKVPRTIDFMSELPRQPTGKLEKRRLREPYWEGTGRRL